MHNPELQIFIATNLKIDEQFAGIKLLTISEELAKLNIETKLHLDKFLQTEETLFIDSDCLCYGSLDSIFNSCKGMDVTVIGRQTEVENYWGSSAIFAREHFLIDKSIYCNGALYYMRKSALTKKIFKKAREIATKYDEYNFPRIKNNWKNEEDLLSIAMIANNQQPLEDNGEFFSDLATDQRPQILNVLKGEKVLRNPANSSTLPKYYYPKIYSPIIVHFGGSNINSYPYISQSFSLKLKKMGLPIFLSGFLSHVFIHMPYRSYHYLRRKIDVTKY